MTKDCNGCQHSTYDMDGVYCAHAEAMRQSIFGKSWTAMVREGGPCGPDRVLYERRRIRVKAGSAKE